MSKFKIYLFNLILLVIIFCNSCGKPCRKEEIKQCAAHPTYDKYFGVYQVGNYWIFESDSNIFQDSLFVETDRKDLRELNEETCEKYFAFVKVCLVENINNSFKLFESVYSQTTSCSNGLIEFYYNPNKDNKVLIDLNNDVFESMNAEILPEVVIDTITFYEVLHIYIEDKDFYFSDELGLFSYKILNSDSIMSTYNLKDYFIQ